MDSYKSAQGDIPTFADKGENFRKKRRDILKDIKKHKS